FDSAGARDAGARNLGFVVLESLGHDHLNAMLRPGHRVADWLGFRLEDTWDRHPRRTAVHVKLEVDRGEDRGEHFGDDEAEDVEERALRRVLAREEREQGVALLRRWLVVSESLNAD